MTKRFTNSLNGTQGEEEATRLLDKQDIKRELRHLLDELDRKIERVQR